MSYKSWHLKMGRFYIKIWIFCFKKIKMCPDWTYILHGEGRQRLLWGGPLGWELLALSYQICFSLYYLLISGLRLSCDLSLLLWYIIKSHFPLPASNLFPEKERKREPGAALLLPVRGWWSYCPGAKPIAAHVACKFLWCICFSLEICAKVAFAL